MGVLTKASITIQIIEDVAIYKAQIFSSNGNIFGTNDKTSEIHLVVWKGLNDITDRFDDIVWRRFTSKESGYQEDLSWGDKFLNQKSFTLTRDDISERAKIQVEVYAPINGQRQLVAVDYINFIDVNDLQGSPTPPENPKHGDLWLDTSVTPPRLMMWDDNLKMWVEVTIAGRDRRNLLRNSNFYKATTDYWEAVNNPILEIESLNAKKWLRIKSDTSKPSLCGVKQVVKNVAPKSNYTFQMLSEVYIQSGAPEGNALVTFYSIDDNNTKTLLHEEVYDIVNNAKIFTSTFTTLENTKSIEVNISGEKNKVFDFLVTNTKLENYLIATEWELAIEDVQDALDNKVGNTHEEIFNSLTDDGKMQGMYVDIDEHGRKNFYFNATYIKSGKLLGDYIDAKNLKVVKDNGDVTLNIDSKGNVDIKARKMQILVSNDETEEEEFEDAAGVSDIAWKIDIISTNGLVFKNNTVSTVLKAIVYKGKRNVTETINASRFTWKRISNSEEDDIRWNETKGKGVKEITLTTSDVYQRATFICEIEDE